MIKNKDGLLPVFIAMAILIVISVGCLVGFNLWANRELSTEEDMAQIAVAYDGGEITKGEFVARYADSVALFESTYGTTEGYESQILNYALYNVMTDRIVPMKAEELGLAELSEEDTAKLNAAVQERIDAAIETYKAELLTEEEKALSEEEQNQIVIDALAAEGVTEEFLFNQERTTLLADRLINVVAEDVTVSDEDAKAFYDEQIETDRQYYADAWYYAMMKQFGGTTPLYAPEGVRTVRHILLKQDEATMTEYASAAAALSTANGKIATVESNIADLNEKLAAAENGETAEDAEPIDVEAVKAELAAKEAELAELNASLADLQAAADAAAQAVIASVQPKLDEINARIANGEDFNALIEEYNEDPGMTDADGNPVSYYVCEDAYHLVTEFVDAAMAIEEIGGVSAPTVSNSGVHIIYYESDVPAGDAALEDVMEYITGAMKEEKVNEAYAAKIEEWMLDYNFTVYTDVLGIQAGARGLESLAH